jgi:dTDP-D-glucose 4,6-dehydratase
MKLEHMYEPKDDETKFVPWLISQLQQGVERVPLAEGKQLRDFIYIDDVVTAYMKLLGKTGVDKSLCGCPLLSDRPASTAESTLGTGKAIQ